MGGEKFPFREELRARYLGAIVEAISIGSVRAKIGVTDYRLRKMRKEAEAAGTTFLWEDREEGMLIHFQKRGTAGTYYLVIKEKEKVRRRARKPLSRLAQMDREPQEGIAMVGTSSLELSSGTTAFSPGGEAPEPMVSPNPVERAIAADSIPASLGDSRSREETSGSVATPHEDNPILQGVMDATS